jgi:hypothetical protein
MQEQIHIETLIKQVEILYERLLDDRYALGKGLYAQMVTKGHRERVRAYQQRYYLTTLKARRAGSSRWQPPQPAGSQPASRQPPSSTARSFTLFSR